MNMTFLRIGIVITFFLFASWPVESAESRVFKAGAAAVDITPTVFDAPAQGNGVTVIADKVKDPLFARCLCLHDGKETIMLLVIDLCWIRSGPADRIKTLIHEKTGVPKDRIMVSTTHTHSAPMIREQPVKGETNFTPEKVAQAGIEAHANLAPAKIGWAVGNDPKNVFCRRFQMQDGVAPFNPGMGPRHDRAMMNPGSRKKISPTAPVDSLIPMLSVVSPDGTPIAVFANYSSHHAWRGLKADEISGDRFGVFSKEMKRLIAEKVGPDKMSDKFVAIMAQGTSGDANCNNFLDPDRQYSYESVGRDNAEAAMVVWPNIEYFDWVPIRMTQRVIRVDCYQPSAEDIQAAKAFLADEKNASKSRILLNSVRSIASADKWTKTEDVPLQAMRIGEFGITTLPGEFFSLTGIDLKAKSPFQPTMNIGVANTNFSYVPPPEQFDLGGYATWRSSYRNLGVGAEPLIKKTLLEMLEELK